MKDKKINFNIKNKMSEEQLEDFKKSIEYKAVPVTEMEEGRIMPVFILGLPMKFKTFLGETNCDLMLSISHLIKQEQLEIRGRMRFESTGNKTIFSIKKTFKKSEYDDAKDKIYQVIESMTENMPLYPVTEPWELEFPFDATMDEIVKKMDDSNHFDIGSIEK